MRVAVITPYYKESSAYLRRAHQSVLAQTHETDHFMVADGFPNPLVEDWAVDHIVLPRPHGDYGDTPRTIGSLSALSRGYEAIAFLDADNWYRPDHIELMVKAHRDTGHNICVASRSMHRLDGSLMYIEPSDENHVDTSCFFLVGEATRMVALMGIKPQPLSEVNDRIFWKSLRSRGFGFTRVPEPTVAYTSKWKITYEAMGEVPPEGANQEFAGAMAQRWIAEASPEEKRSWSIWLFGGPDRW